MTTTPARSLFQPAVSVTRRPDGRFDVEVDWSSSWVDARELAPEGLSLDEDDPRVAEQIAAVDAWLDRQGQEQGAVRPFIIPAATPED